MYLLHMQVIDRVNGFHLKLYCQSTDLTDVHNPANSPAGKVSNVHNPADLPAVEDSDVDSPDASDPFLNETVPPLPPPMPPLKICVHHQP